MSTRRTSRQRGFTLIEVIVAMVILATTYGAILKILGGAASNTDRIEDYRKALAIAESTLARATAQNLHAGEGEDGDGFRWYIRSEPLPGAAPEDYVSAGAPRLVSATVAWESGAGKLHQVTLQTIRLPERER